MPYNEADTRAKLIDPALHERGWSESMIKREETAGRVEIYGDKPRRGNKRVDYTLRVISGAGPQPVAMALVEAKSEDYHPSHGLEQAKGYADRLNVPFVYSSNGHQFVEYDRFTGLTTNPKPMSEFPSPAQLQVRYELQQGFSLGSSAAKPLVTPYAKGEAARRYYQDAAIRAVMEELARGGNRALLSLATGSGKTFIAVNLLKRIYDAGQLRKALFLCDRDELRTQGLLAFSNEFGNNAAAARAGQPQLNARIIIATYQTLGVERDDADDSFLTTNYPHDYFSHIIIDECHRSAWGKWSEVLRRNPNAVQIGLTATPRSFLNAKPLPEEADKASYTERLRAGPASSPERREDERITANNYDYFGEPIYEYSIGQGIEDGYLATMQVIKRDVFLDGIREEIGVAREALEGKDLTDPASGETLSTEVIREHYNAPRFEELLLLPERVKAMCQDLFSHLGAEGNPKQKTIIFCAGDQHADAVANEMNNLYAHWCRDYGENRAEHYAFKCTAASEGQGLIADFKSSSQRYFVATTVDLLTTGVDVPPVSNIVFFKYVGSPIAFYQMVGRGTRIDPPTGKLSFKVYDYTDATRLFGEDFTQAFRSPAKGDDKEKREIDPESVVQAYGFDVHISPAGHYIMDLTPDGQQVMVTLEEYKQRLAARLVEDIPSLDDFRQTWVQPIQRQELLAKLPEEGARMVRHISEMEEYDLFDVLAELAYGQAAKTREARAESFGYKNRRWLSSMPATTSEVVKAIASQFSRGGTDGLESNQLFHTPEVAQAGGLNALRDHGNAAETLAETKRRMFSA